jgi:hypothetical protein
MLEHFAVRSSSARVLVITCVLPSIGLLSGDSPSASVLGILSPHASRLPFGHALAACAHTRTMRTLFVGFSGPINDIEVDV